MSQWQPIETAPKDGRAILLLSAADWLPVGNGQRSTYRPPSVAIGEWDPEGTSWVDKHGRIGEGCYALAKTGVWLSGGGWFQPNEVTHWMPLPEPPTPTAWDNAGCHVMDGGEMARLLAREPSPSDLHALRSMHGASPEPA